MIPEMEEKILITYDLGLDYADIYLPMYDLFAKAARVDGYSKYAGDSVHPSEAGALFIAEHILSEIDPLIQQSMPQNEER